MPAWRNKQGSRVRLVFCKDKYMKYTKEVLEEAVSKSRAVSEVLRFLGLKQAGGNFSHISFLLKKYEINTEHFLGKLLVSKTQPPANKHTKESFLNMLKENVNLNGYRTKHYLIKFGIKEYKCENCNRTEWFDKKIPLEVEHIDGNHFNNRLENLKLLCPNCHAITDTYCSKIKGVHRQAVKSVVLEATSKVEP